MRRIFVFWVVVLSWTGTMWAQQISQQEALNRVVKCMSQQRVGRRAPARSSELVATPVKASSIYAFNRQGGGYVIASADSRALPILGYSDTGSIDWEQMPENMRAWLMQYDEAMATLGDRTDLVDGNWVNGTSKRTAHEAVEPLIKTHWNQLEPYWNQCPIYGGDNPEYEGKRSYTGCVATAMAQIMNYYRWPSGVPDGLPGYMPFDEMGFGLWYIDALPPVTFDWDHMLDTYCATNPETGVVEVLGTEEEQDAVATLIRYCGQAAKMAYHPLGSGALESDAAVALRDIFGYPAAQYLYRDDILEIDEWEDLLYDELANGRPIEYGGYSGSYGGHEFVVDGYDGNGLFHINWGWGGVYDGYFVVSVLSPIEQNAPGGGHHNFGFSCTQKVIIHTDPSMEPSPVQFTPAVKLYQYAPIKVSDGNITTITFAYLYEELDKEEISMDIALATMEADGTLTPRFLGDPNDSIVFSGNVMDVVVDSMAFQPGESMTLYPIYRFRAPGAQWQLLRPAASHIVAGRNADGRFYIDVYGNPSTVICTDARVAQDTLTVGEACDLTITMWNPMDFAISGYVYISPCYFGDVKYDDSVYDMPYTKGTPMYYGISMLSGEKKEYTVSFTPEQAGLVLLNVCLPSGFFIGEIAIEVDENPQTGCIAIEADKGRVADKAIYDLTGRRQKTPTRKGIYIIDNRKVIIN
ncbi:MAG: C10 family peptidase [Bacteroidaceae bacterium]|nr:C10 family peptidase [Bacteroidaceae bacterium]